MNDPIVSPWLIYLLGQADAWQAALFVFSATGGVLSFVAFVFWISTVNECYMENENKVAGKCLKFALPVVLPIMLLAFLCPGRDTLIAMCVAKNATPANITKAVDAGKNIKDELVADIVEIIHGKADEGK